MSANAAVAQSNADFVVVETLSYDHQRAHRADRICTRPSGVSMTANGKGIFINGNRVTIAEAKALQPLPLPHREQASDCGE